MLPAQFYWLSMLTAYFFVFNLIVILRYPLSVPEKHQSDLSFNSKSKILKVTVHLYFVSHHSLDIVVHDVSQKYLLHFCMSLYC